MELPNYTLKGKYVIVVIEYFAYADESGTHGDEALYCVVAGFVGSSRQWKYFEKDWRKVLSDFSVIEFHSKEFFSRKFKENSSKNPYRGWSDQKASLFLRQLVSVLMKRQLHSIGSAVDIEAFNTFSHGERQFLTNGRLRKGTVHFVSSGAPKRPPYQLAFSTMLYVAAEKVENDVKVNYIFDQNNVEKALALDVFKATKEKQAIPEWSKLNGIEFANSRAKCGLQAADLYAYLWNSLLTRRHDMNTEQEGVLKKLTAKNRYNMDFWDGRTMEAALSKLTDEQRLDLKAMK